MKTVRNLMARSQHQELVTDTSCGHPTIAILSNYALIRSSVVLVSSLIIPYQMNEYFNIHFFDRGVII